jgi:hypothetical protein
MLAAKLLTSSGAGAARKDKEELATLAGYLLNGTS